LSKALWDRVYAALEGHRRHTDADAQAALDRIAAKVLGLVGPQSFNSSTCAIREEALSLDQCEALAVYHTRAAPLRDDDRIVVLETGGRRFVVDGNNRVNAWRQSGKVEHRTMLVLTPKSELQGRE
jgi:hypothetical protein